MGTQLDEVFTFWKHNREMSFAFLTAPRIFLFLKAHFCSDVYLFFLAGRLGFSATPVHTRLPAEKFLPDSVCCGLFLRGKGSGIECTAAKQLGKCSGSSSTPLDPEPSGTGSTHVCSPRDSTPSIPAVPPITCLSEVPCKGAPCAFLLLSRKQRPGNKAADLRHVPGFQQEKAVS